MRYTDFRIAPLHFLSARRRSPAPSLETPVRYLLAAITLGAAGVGFSYLNQPTASSAPTERAALRPLFDWDHDQRESVAGEPPSTVRDAVKRVQVQSDSILDKFVREHGYSVQALDDALTQVQDVARSSLDQASVSSGDGIADPATQSSAAIQRRPDPWVRPDQGVRPTNDPQADNKVRLGGTSSPNEAVHDELARANPSVVQTEPAPEPKHSSTPAASVHEATIVCRDNGPPAAPEPEIAQVAAKEAAVAKAPTKAVEKKVTPASEWKVIGKTTEGRPLHTRRYGDDGPRTLIVAGLDGEDRIAVRWIDLLADELARRPELYLSSEVLVFRAGNPDGLMKKVSENSRGVLINRNFPSRRYRPLPDLSSGAGPATEAETRALLDNLYTFHPRRVIHLTATSARTRVAYNRSAREIAGELQRAYSLDIQPLDIEQYPGSLEDFADGTLEAGVLSIQLNVGDDWQRIWSKHQPAMLTAVTGRVLDQQDAKPQDELTRSAPEAVRSPIPVSTNEPLRKKIRSGYEELPAPPQ